MLLDAASFKHQLTLLQDGAPVFLVPYQVEIEGRNVFADRVTVDGSSARAEFGESVITDDFTFEAGRFSVRRSWRLEGDFAARLSFSVLRRGGVKLWISPGAMYGSPVKNGRSIIEVREGMSAVPSFLFIEDEELYYAVFSQPAGICAEASAVRGIAGGEYSEATIVLPGGSGSQPILSHGQLSFERTFYVAFGRSGPGTLRQALEHAWELLTFEPSPPADWSDMSSALSSALMNRFYIERGETVGFVRSLKPSMWPANAALSADGPGGNITAARALYNIAKNTNDHDLKRRALDIADFFLGGAEDPGGMRTEYNIARHRWHALPDEDAALKAAGDMLHGYLLLHRDSRRAGDHNSRWMRACRAWADEAVEKISPGAPEKRDAQTEAPAPGDASAAFYDAHKIIVLASLAKIYQGAGYRTSAEKIAARLLPLCSKSAWCGDGGAPSRDDAMAVLRAMLLLHNLTSHSEYLHAANGIATLLLSYTWCYQACMPERSPLAKIGFRSFGGVTIMPGRAMPDLASPAVALEFLRLDSALGAPTLRRAALAQLEFASRPFLPESAPLHTWHGFPPAAFDLGGGAAFGIESATAAATLAALIDLSEEFPDKVKIKHIIPPRETSFRLSLGRTLLNTGCLLKR